jgi:hypothetical protein
VDGQLSLCNRALSPLMGLKDTMKFIRTRGRTVVRGVARLLSTRVVFRPTIDSTQERSLFHVITMDVKKNSPFKQLWPDIARRLITERGISAHIPAVRKS